MHDVTKSCMHKRSIQTARQINGMQCKEGLKLVAYITHINEFIWFLIPYYNFKKQSLVELWCSDK